MLVKFFNHGTKASGNTTANSVKNYLLNERVKDGTAKIIRGDEPLTSATIDSSEYPSTYTAGCLSFDKNESLTDEQKQELMQSFEQALLPNFDPTRYACYWVEHTDKDRLELNFVFARIDLATGKNLNVYYHRRDEKRLNNWKEIQIQKYDLKDPNDPKYEQGLKPFYSKRANGSRIGDRLEYIKKTLHNAIADGINAGKIKNRQGVINFIANTKDSSQAPIFEIVKETKTSLTIKHIAKNETFRLKGSFYGRAFDIDPTQAVGEAQTLIQADRQSRHNKYVANKAERLANAVDWYARLCKQRADEIDKKHGKEPPSTRPSTNLAPQPPQPTENFNHATPRKSQDARERTGSHFTERADTDRYGSTNYPLTSENRPITGENRTIVASPSQLFGQCRKIIDEILGKFKTVRDRFSSRIEKLRKRIDHRDTQQQKRLEKCEQRNADLVKRISKSERPFAETLKSTDTELTSDIKHGTNRAQASENELRASQDWLREYNQRAGQDDNELESKLSKQRQADFDPESELKRFSNSCDISERWLGMAKQADTTIRETAKRVNGNIADDTPILQLVPIVKQELKPKEPKQDYQPPAPSPF